MASCEIDFNEVIGYLKSKKIISQTPPSRLLATAKKIHKSTYSLILWRFLITSLPENGKVFLDEIASDAIQILPQALMGYQKTIDLLSRGIIENVTRHIYYCDHPVEFEITNREKKWYPSLEQLFEYLKRHPSFIKTEKKFDAINRLRTFYDNLSANIHGRKVSNLEMKKALNDIKFVQAKFDEQKNALEKCTEASNFLLVKYHHDLVGNFHPEFRRLILHTIAPKARRVLHGLI